MTYCLTIKIKDGLIALADCRVTSGTEVTTARKVLVLTAGAGKFFIMSSGLRSVRDKVVAYVEREIAQNPNQNNMLDIINLFTRCMRQAEREDRVRLEQSGLLYNAHAIVGGMMPGDKEPTAYMVYPEANWVEVDHRTPFLAIGATAYGKPILDRALHFETGMATALKMAYLSFDSTRLSSSDVGFPIDIVTYSTKDGLWRERHLEYEDLKELHMWWNEHIAGLVMQSPNGPWMQDLLG